MYLVYKHACKLYCRPWILWIGLVSTSRNLHVKMVVLKWGSGTKKVIKDILLFHTTILIYPIQISHLYSQFPIAPVYLRWRIWSQNVANDMLCKHYILHYWYLVVIFVSCKYTIVQTTTHWCKLVRWQKKFTSLGSCNFKGVNNSNNFQDLDMNHCISAQYYLLF